MLEIAVQLVVFGVVIAIVAAILQAALAPRYQFMIQIKGAKFTVTKGKVTADFLDKVRAVCGRFCHHLRLDRRRPTRQIVGVAILRQHSCRMPTTVAQHLV